MRAIIAAAARRPRPSRRDRLTPDLDNFFLNVRTSAILSFRRSARFAFGRGNGWGKGRKIPRSGVCQFFTR
jgi:hypothetical protein